MTCERESFQTAKSNINPLSNSYQPDILFEDNHLIAVNKRCGEIVQGDKTGDECLADRVKAYIKTRYAKPGDVFLGVVHRLDRPVSGALLFARTSKALERMNSMFREKTIQKTYWAIVKSIPPENEGRLINHLIRNEKLNKSFVVPMGTSNSKESILDYKLLASSDKYHLLEIKLHTGRHHQIRCQLAHIGCPIKGDLKYGFPRSNENAGIDLHSRKIEFIHPVAKTRICVIAPLPETELWHFFGGLAE